MWEVLEGPAALIGCLPGLNQLPVGCRVDNSGITVRQSPWVHKRRRDVVPFSLFKNTGLCARAPVASLQPRGAYQTGTPRGRLAASFFDIFHCLFLFLVFTSTSAHPASSRVPLYPAAAARRASPASRPDQWKEIPRGIKQGWGRRRAAGYKLLHKRDLCSAAGSQCATEAFHFVVIANCNSPRHMISPDDNRGSRRGSRNLLFAP